MSDWNYVWKLMSSDEIERLSPRAGREVIQHTAIILGIDGRHGIF
jgi:hypothetical protein